MGSVKESKGQAGGMPAPWAPAAALGSVVLIVTGASAHVHVEAADLNRALLPGGPRVGDLPLLGFSRMKHSLGCGEGNNFAFPCCDTQRVSGHRDRHQALCWDPRSWCRGLSPFSSSQAGQKATGCLHGCRQTG